MKWESVKLADLCTVITKGTTPSNIGAEFKNCGINYIRSEMITNAKYIASNGMLYISNETHEKLKRSQLQKDDILFSMAGVYLGKTAVLREEDVPANTNQAVALIRIDSLKCNLEYVYYFLNLPETVTKVNTVSGQAAQPNINLKQIGNMEIRLPSLENQNKIASILSAYDDLIENNQKQIKLLEEAAQRLYKEWFVDLRFPNYENTPVVDGVPEGWKIEKIGNFVSTTSGGTPSRTHKEYYESGTNLWVKTQELKDSYIIDTDEKITDEAIKKSSAKIIPNGSLLLAMYGATIGKLGIANCDLTCNQACCVFLFENDIWKREYLYCWLIENRVFLVSQGKGAAQPNLSQALIKAIEILIPNENLVKRFSKIASVVFQKKCNLEIQIKSLNEARDRLLPKLMSGELEV